MIERIKIIIEYEQISVRAFELKIGASNGLIRKAITNNTDIQGKWLSVIADNYPHISTEWLLTGRGHMLRDGKIEDIQLPKIENPIKVEDNCLMKLLIERNEALAVENHVLKQEVEQLKSSRGKSTNTPNYDLSSEKIGTHIAAEPRTY